MILGGGAGGSVGGFWPSLAEVCPSWSRTCCCRQFDPGLIILGQRFVPLGAICLYHGGSSQQSIYQRSTRTLGRHCLRLSPRAHLCHGPLCSPKESSASVVHVESCRATEDTSRPRILEKVTDGVCRIFLGAKCTFLLPGNGRSSVGDSGFCWQKMG